MELEDEIWKVRLKARLKRQMGKLYREYKLILKNCPECHAGVIVRRSGAIADNHKVKFRILYKVLFFRYEQDTECTCFEKVGYEVSEQLNILIVFLMQHIACLEAGEGKVLI